MYIHVKLLKEFKEPLLYKVPEHWSVRADALIGAIVQVPLKNRTTFGLVVAVVDNHVTSFNVKEALALEEFPHDATYGVFLEQLCTYYQIEPRSILKRIRHFLGQSAAPLPNYEQAPEPTQPIEGVTLTPEQEHVCHELAPAITKPRYWPAVLHGVTGSGKTEVYKHLMMQAFAQKKSVLFLLPEVTLAMRFEKLLRAQLPDISFFGFHCATLPREKARLWQALLGHHPLVIIGVHLPVLIPIAQLGLIIIDEEHEVGYQEKKHPKINTKEAALLRARSAGIPILLGSATPSLSSLYNIHAKGWQYLKLTNRFAGAFPTIKTVFLVDAKQRRNFWISKELEDAIRDRLSKNEQIIIFLNRRGYSLFVQCKECSFIFTCSYCSVSLTLHQDATLTCHYCNHMRPLPATCPQCAVSQAHFLKKGIGTQQVVTILQKLFPHIRIGRADLDVTKNKRLWQATMSDFEQGALDVLVGTQTITKGLHFPRVTLVGILWADINFHFPMYNATETALQQLIQVAGRAGRQSPESLVIVQTMSDHRILQFLDEQRYSDFYEQELEYRTALKYPPCGRLVEIELKYEHEATLESEAYAIARHLRLMAQNYDALITILGPAKPLVHTIKQQHARKIYLKGASITHLQHLFQSITVSRYKSSIFFTPNPIT
jgi:primosomal protein N' (replication factor Y) (superfamily II helicase)